MRLTEKKAFAFDLLNELGDSLRELVYDTVARQIRAVNDHKSLDDLIAFLQGAGE